MRGRAKDELNDLTNKANDSREKVREVLSAIHEGEAEDKDLAKAVKQANSALDNLKKYLKKYSVRKGRDTAKLSLSLSEPRSPASSYMY